MNSALVDSPHPSPCESLVKFSMSQSKNKKRYEYTVETWYEGALLGRRVKMGISGSKIRRGEWQEVGGWVQMEEG